MKKEEGRRKKEEGRGKKEEGRRKKEEGRRKREEGRGKKENRDRRDRLWEENFSFCRMPNTVCTMSSIDYP